MLTFVDLRKDIKSYLLPLRGSKNSVAKETLGTLTVWINPAGEVARFSINKC
jgi:hypothetical protein